jgi:hypothetical protein
VRWKLNVISIEGAILYHIFHALNLFSSYHLL